MNAVEVMQDGKVFIKGVANYVGTNPTGDGVKDVATVWNELTGFSEWEVEYIKEGFTFI